MKAAIWAEIRRLHEIERLSGRAIARKLGCSRDLVKRALTLVDPPTKPITPSRSKLDPFKSQIETILARYPDLSAVRVLEKISQPKDGQLGYSGGLSLLRGYLRHVRPTRSRVYQDVSYSPGEALQIDWGDAGKLKIGKRPRRVSVFVAVLGYPSGVSSTIMGATAMQFGETVRRLRIGLGLTQQEIADQTKVSVSYISKVENEKLHFGDYPSEKFIHRLAEVLKADEDQLLLLADKVPEVMRLRIRQRPELFRRIAMMDNNTLDALEKSINREQKKNVVKTST